MIAATCTLAELGRWTGKRGGGSGLHRKLKRPMDAQEREVAEKRRLTGKRSYRRGEGVFRWRPCNWGGGKNTMKGEKV